MNEIEILPEDPVAVAAREIFGLPYLYPWQRLVVAAVLDTFAPPVEDESPEPLRQIVILPTGGGKSLCWMLPAVMIPGITVAVFPLLSLMADQKRRLAEVGVPTVTLRGGQDRGERAEIWRKLETGKTRIVLANPEVLRGRSVADHLARIDPAHLVVDETHTVSEWGETFRPACAELGSVVADWNPPAVTALTATASPVVRERITALLFGGEAPRLTSADPDRPAIRYGVLPVLSRNHILERLAREEHRPLIVFGSTRAGVAEAARLLRRRLNDHRIRYYHAGLSREEKARTEEWFRSSSDGILCATCAYGMGVDKADIRTVIHLSPPSSVEAYLQESGRASRDRKGANAWLIRTPDDRVESEDESVAMARRRAMIRFAVAVDRCRRESLLGSLGIEAQDCTGCDVCGGTPWESAPEADVIRRFFRMNPKRYRKGKAARILTGRKSEEVRRGNLDEVRGFGLLKGWEMEDVEEAIDAMVREGALRYGRIGPIPNRLLQVR